MNDSFDIYYPPEPFTPTLDPRTTDTATFFGPDTGPTPGSRCYCCFDVFDSENPPARTLKDYLSVCYDCVWVLKSGL